MTRSRLADIARARQAGQRYGLPSICTAHPVAIEAALREGGARGCDVLIEATCNQVNQDGGYTGMTPAAFRRFVEDIAARVGFDTGRLILGGDHLGPNPWKHLPPEAAMAKASAMVEAYVQAGFTKLHLDTSMGCRGEAPALSDDATASRAAELARAAEAAAGATADGLAYVIGTEVPVPGGAHEEIDHLEPTRPEAALATADIHRAAFSRAGAEAAFERVIALVVQPGVEFGNANVIPYDRPAAAGLSAALARMPQFVFEAHSTDYQSPGALAALVEDGFAILKVGPWLTFAIREALYGLDAIAQVLAPAAADQTLQARMERLMLAEPQHWDRYYHGSADERRIQRHFSYSDRIRYYWPHRDAQAALRSLAERLSGRTIPATLISQYLPALPADEQAPARWEHLLERGVRQVLSIYFNAATPTGDGPTRPAANPD